MNLVGHSLLLAISSMSVALPANAQQPASKRPPLVLDEQGTFFVGGKIEKRAPNTTLVVDPRFGEGDIAVNQMYVEYQIPAGRRKYPIILMHGGGHSGAVFNTTPDGREGWYTSFTRRGYAVYNVDAPNRGRAGWDPTNRFAVSLGEKPASSLEPGNIYSTQTAWVAFRFGREYPVQFPGQQFPIEHLDDYLKQVIPSYRTPEANDLIATDLKALLDRIGPSILLGWSTGTLNVTAASLGKLDKVKGLILIEATADVWNPAKIDDKQIAKIPLLSIYGDNQMDDLLDKSKAYTARLKAAGSDATTVALPDVGIKGNGHVMMAERNSEQIAELIGAWIAQHVPD